MSQLPRSDAPLAESPALVERVLARLWPAPFWDHLGCLLLSAAPGIATVRFPNRPEHDRSSKSGDGTAHGGAVASLVDMVASCAQIAVLEERESGTTIDLAVHCLAPARGPLTGVATVRRRGGRTAVIDVEITADDGTLAARSVRRRGHPGGGRRARGAGGGGRGAGPGAPPPARGVRRPPRFRDWYCP